MATAKQLPSGSWRVRVYDKELGKQVSFTSQLEGKAGKAEAELMAREYQLGKKKKALSGKTVGECIDEYIELKENILSPTTINGYKKYRRNYFDEIIDLPVNELTAATIQSHFNLLAVKYSAKTVKNTYGLLSAAITVYKPELSFKTTLPKVQKKIKTLPAVKDLLTAIIGTDIELPCLLAMWCSLRMSELRAVKKSDIKDGVLTIKSALVNVDGEHIEKSSTKTIESTRQLRLPQRILSLIDALPQDQEYITIVKDHALYMRFTRLLKRKGIEHMSFHDLRHMSASIMLALNIPDKYAMERGGWSTSAVMKSVYQHTFSKERQAVDDKIDNYFNNLLNEIDTAQ